MHHVLVAAVKAAATGCPIETKASGSSIFASIAKPIADVLSAVYSVIPNYAIAIVALSVLWMLIIAPLTLKSTRSMLAMQKLQPELKRLQAEYKNDRQAFAQAQMDLFKQHNVSPFGSCLPMLLPLPVFFALFRVIDGLSHTVTVAGKICAEPNYLSPHTAMYKAIVAGGGQLNSFGLDLSKNALSGHSSFFAALPYFLLLLVMIGTQYLQTAQMMSRNKAAADNPQAKMMKYLPIIFGVIFIRFPAGVILYYAMSNVCRVVQQTAMYRFDPKVKALADHDLKEVASEIDEIESGKRKRTPVKSLDAAPGPRSRFRELLAGAVDQQQARSGGTPGGKAPTSGKTPTNGRPGGGAKGAPPRNGRPQGQARTGQPARPARPGAPGKPGAPAKAAAPTKGAPVAKNAGTPPKNGAAAAKTGGTQPKNDSTPARPSGAPRVNGNGSSGNGVGNGNGNGTSNGNGAPRPRTGGSRTGATAARPGPQGGRGKKRRGR